MLPLSPAMMREIKHYRDLELEQAAQKREFEGLLIDEIQVPAPGKLRRFASSLHQLIASGPTEMTPSGEMK